jgi:hypothetical protein
MLINSMGVALCELGLTTGLLGDVVRCAVALDCSGGCATVRKPWRKKKRDPAPKETHGGKERVAPQKTALTRNAGEERSAGRNGHVANRQAQKNGRHGAPAECFAT